MLLAFLTAIHPRRQTAKRPGKPPHASRNQPRALFLPTTSWRWTQPVLIHSAAGGIGLACVQLAQHVGAEVMGRFAPRPPHKAPVAN
jgi:NADPH:quinone reductase-like Zn-dependent oxidoreductase